MTAADLIVQGLQARGVPFIATLNGHGLDPFYLACRRAGMRMIDVRNEQSASYIAEVTGRLSRSVGVCAVSGGVAHANALTGVVNAWFDGAPMLLITGTAPLEGLATGAFQAFMPWPMAAPACKYSRVVDAPERAAPFLDEALAAANQGRPGPVHLSLPMDIAAKEVDSPSPPAGAGDSAPIDEGAVRAAASLVAAARRPVLVAGSGVYYSRGERALARFMTELRIPTVVPIWDRGSVPEPHEAFLGVIGAASGGPRLLPDADLVLLAGADLDYRLGSVAPPECRDVRVIHVHPESGRLRRARKGDVSVLGCPAAALDRIVGACASLRFSPPEAWLAEACRRRDEHLKKCLSAAPPGTSAVDVVHAVREVLTDDTLLLVDGGNIGQWFHQLLADRYPGHWVTCGASGVVGWGLPGAMAARALYPDRPVILLSGDGSFTFTVAELECAARQGLAFVAVVADDEEWGISVTGHVKKHGAPLYSKLGPTRLDRVAEGFGCRGLRIERKEELVPALREALDDRRPTVLQVPIVPSSPADAPTSAP